MALLLLGILAPARGADPTGGSDPASPGRATITLAEDASRSYELLLPRGYDPEGSYPTLILLHSAGWGPGYADHLGSLVDDGGWILAFSNDFDNGLSSDDFAPLIAALRQDLTSRFAVDPDRLHLGGLSGGGMASTVTAYLDPGRFRGLVLNSGVIHEALLNTDRLKKTGLARVALLSGSTDSVTRPRELDACRQWFEAAGIEAQVFTFEGGHQLAPLETYREALGWLATP